ncbi:AAA family ATPase [Desulfococcaceae bacterium HSG8]|nr:AAA family ATPase [Desulfococcaceae bacterium HSG8]
MLDDVTITGFRGLDGLLMQGTSKYNLIVGLNNSGKSSLLEALFLHCSPLSFQVLLALISFRCGSLKINQHSIFEQLGWFFTKKLNIPDTRDIRTEGVWNGIRRKTNLSIEHETDGKSLEKLLSADSPPLKFGQPVRQSESEGIRIGTISFSFCSDKQDEIIQRYDFSMGNFEIHPPKIKADINAVFLEAHFHHRNPEAGIEEYDKSVKRDYDKKCLRLMQKIDPDIEDMSILLTASGSPQLFVSHKKLGRAPLSNFGDGIKRMYMIAASMVACEGGVFFIDELESAIHSDALKTLADWISQAAEELDVQIFATTHSLECIDALLGSNFSESDNLSLFKLGWRNDRISCKKISGNILKDARYELGLDVRR